MRDRPLAVCSPRANLAAARSTPGATRIASGGRGGAGEGRALLRYWRGSGGRAEAVVEEGVRRMSEQQEPVRIPKDVLEELESVRRYTRAKVLDIPTLRHVAMETQKPALVVWIDNHEQEYGQGLLNGFRAEDS